VLRGPCVSVQLSAAPPSTVAWGPPISEPYPPLSQSRPRAHVCRPPERAAVGLVPAAHRLPVGQGPSPTLHSHVVPLATRPSPASPRLRFKRCRPPLHPLFFLSTPFTSASKPPPPLLHTATALVCSSVPVSHSPSRIHPNYPVVYLHQ
jgi:hypothetical protein